MPKQVDVLNLEWPNNERDVHAISPIILELRNRGYKCISGDIFSYPFYLIKYRPKLLLLTSFQGALINHNLCLLASILGVKVVTLIAEGNTRETAIEEMTWGNNKLKKLYFEKMLLWSYRSEGLMHKYFDQLKGKTGVVGGVGFDRYKRLDFMDKETFFRNEKKENRYRAVIGLAGWGFDRVHDTDFYFKNEKSILANFKTGQKELHRSDFKKIQHYYLEVIRDNPDVLFILRPHPGLTDYFYDEFKELKSFSNVYYSKPRKCKYSISDLISVADIWGGYETTTCLEAWLLGKETFLVNPNGGGFNRDVTAKGSFIVTELDVLKLICRKPDLIKDCFPDSENIIKERAKVIEGVIGFDDGKNYLRAVNEISPVIDSSEYSKYGFIAVLSKVGLINLIKSVLRNIAVLNKLRGLRSIDNNQVERMISLYKRS